MDKDMLEKPKQFLISWAINKTTDVRKKKKDSGTNRNVNSLETQWVMIEL